jgi:co-chaperonin GroES (HSP10)
MLKPLNNNVIVEKINEQTVTSTGFSIPKGYGDFVKCKVISSSSRDIFEEEIVYVLPHNLRDIGDGKFVTMAV